MGTWGRGSFENDDAMEWAAEFAGSPSLDALVDTIGEVADPSDVEEVQGHACARAVAAVELVAACLDGQRGGLPDRLAGWSAEIPNHLARKAGRALERVLRDSELNDLWAETDEHADWRRDIEALRTRLPF